MDARYCGQNAWPRQLWGIGQGRWEHSRQRAALPDGLGMPPGSMTVTDEGLTFGFIPKGRPG